MFASIIRVSVEVSPLGGRIAGIRVQTAASSTIQTVCNEERDEYGENQDRNHRPPRGVIRTSYRAVLQTLSNPHFRSLIRHCVDRVSTEGRSELAFGDGTQAKSASGPDP